MESKAWRSKIEPGDCHTKAELGLDKTSCEGGDLGLGGTSGDEGDLELGKTSSDEGHLGLNKPAATKETWD